MEWLEEDNEVEDEGEEMTGADNGSEGGINIGVAVEEGRESIE